MVSVITSISYDHMAVLGTTLTKIAVEKAGIIKEGREVAISPQTEEARKVILQIAKERNSPVTQVGVDYLFASRSHSLWGQTFYIWSKKDQDLVDEFINSSGRLDWEPDRFEIPLLGYHQIENAATAYAALQIAKKYDNKITNKDILDGFSRVKWPARFEILRRDPPVIVDSAHNRDSVLRLRLAMNDYLPDLPIILVFGASEDKDIEGMFAELLPKVDKVIATRSVHPRAIEPEELIKIAHRFGKQAIAFSSVEEALREANRLAQREAAILVTGSIFIAAAARAAWSKIVNES
jgi:dihydrofolate synthase/folylpolyglutamate synthase